MARVLIAEDESVLADAIAVGLERRGHRVCVAYDGADALAQVHGADFDVVVLDRALPYVCGDAVCKDIVATQAGARVIMVSASVEVKDRVAGLSLGADDYLTKPFAFEELAARVDVLARRPRTRRDAAVTAVADLSIDSARRSVTRAGRPVELTVKEFGVLQALAAVPGCWISAESLLERVWDQNTDPFTSAVKVTISTLRRKLGEPNMIATLRGVGYRLEAGFGTDRPR